MKLSDLTDRQWFMRLNHKRIADLRRQRHLWSYYDGEQPLFYVARIIQEQQNRFPALTVNWCALVADALEERLTIEGFRLADEDATDDDLEGMWQSNNLSAAQTEVHIAAMVTRTSYLMVGPGEGRYPLITTEYPDQVSVEVDPRSGRVIAALKVWREDENELGSTHADRAVLYLPGRMVEFEAVSPVASNLNKWAAAADIRQQSQAVPVVPVTWRPRRGVGRTELAAIMPLADGINQTATNMMAGIEHHAVSRKYAIGMSEDEFVDEQGNQIPAWKIANGAVWALKGETVEEDKAIRVGQFTASDMTNYHNSIKQLAQLAGSLYGLPQQYMGYFADNPASAEGIRASESRLIKRAERAQVVLEDPWETAMRLGMAIMGRDPADGDRIETVWREPSTPTRAQVADATVKLHAEGLVDTELGQELIGLSKGQIDGMRSRASRRVSQAPAIIDRVRAVEVTGAAAIGA